MDRTAWKSVEMPDMARWRGVEETLLSIDALLIGTDMEGAMERFLVLIRNGDEARLAEELTSVNTWGRMGSLFDYSPDFPGGPNDTRRYERLEKQLALDLDQMGYWSADMENHFRGRLVRTPRSDRADLLHRRDQRAQWSSCSQTTRRVGSGSSTSMR